MSKFTHLSELTHYQLGLHGRKPVFGVCEHQRHRPACASKQTDQCLCYSEVSYLNLLQAKFLKGPRSAVGNMSGNRCESDCRSRGREFDPDPVPYTRGDWSWNNFYGHSPPFRWIIQEGLLSVTSESMHEVLVNCLFKLAQVKVWLGELTRHDHNCWLGM